MNRIPCQSSNVKSVGYDAATKKLHIEFGSGAVHEYDEVESEQHRALMEAESIGTHFHHQIRNGGFTSRMVSPAKAKEQA